MRFGQGGVALMGVTEVSVNGVVPATLVGIDAGGVTPYSTTAFAIQNVTAGAVLQSVDYAGGALTSLDASGANRLGGGSDVWAAYLASGAGKGVRTNVAGLGPFPSGSLGDVSPDGQLVLIQNADGIGLATYSAAGTKLFSVSATLTGFSTVRARQGFFAYPAEPGWWVRSITTGAASKLAQRADVTLTIPAVVNGKLFVIEYDASKGVSIRLASASQGYVIPNTTANSFNIDAVYLSGTTIRVGMSSGAGELPTELRVFDVNVATGAFQSGVTTSGSLVFTTQPALPPTSALPTNGFTGGGASGGLGPGLYQEPVVERASLRMTEPWYRAINKALGTQVTDLSSGAAVDGVLQPENGGTGTTTGLTELQPDWMQFSDESLLLGRGEGNGGGDGQEISLGAGLTMTGTVLSATGGGGDVVAVGTLDVDTVILGDGGTDVKSLANGTAGQVLTMNAGATAPEWATPTPSDDYVVMSDSVQPPTAMDDGAGSFLYVPYTP